MIDWIKIKQLCLYTESGEMKNVKEPDPAWKKSLLLAEHSPLRSVQLLIEVRGVPSYVQNHLVRHKVGVEFFVHSARPDRGGKPREEQRKTDPCNMLMSANPQALINIARKRLCSRAEAITRSFIKSIKDDIREIEPELAAVMVPECIYRGFCPEGKRGCGFDKTEVFKAQLEEYRG